jgi:hypothetical protein
MRNLNLLNSFRRTDKQVQKYYGGIGDDTCGMFIVPSPIDRKPMVVIASAAAGWDHVSVSRRERCPNWIEMSRVKDLFFNDEEIAMQLHVAKENHINDHPFCLHLWRPMNTEIPLPPAFMVGGMSQEDANKQACEYAKTP